MIKYPLAIILPAALMTATLMLSACAARPAMQGIPVVAVSDKLTSSQQAEIIWQGRSFAFLLTHSAVDDGVQVLGLSLSGQVLFDVRYGDGRLTVVHKADALQRLPVEFLIRDIWWASRPADDVAAALAPIGFSIRDDDKHRQIIESDGKVRLAVDKHQAKLNIHNKHIGYQLILSDTDAQILQ